MVQGIRLWKIKMFIMSKSYIWVVEDSNAFTL